MNRNWSVLVKAFGVERAFSLEGVRPKHLSGLLRVSGCENHIRGGDTVKLRRRIAAIVSACGLGLVLAGPSPGQTVTKTPLRDNPYRDVGGSCIYGKRGEVLFAPKGAKCTDGTNHSAEAGAKGLTLLGEDLPPALRDEARAMIQKHDHIAAEIARLRQAIASGNRETTLEAIDHLIAELTQHLAQEEQFVESVARAH
jgi:hypothetical protein